MGTSGCVGFMFQEKGEIIIEKADRDEEEIMMMAIEAGAEDFVAEEEVFSSKNASEDFSAVKKL